MNYVNAGKRDILLFPKFSNIDKLQKIREKYDELAEILPAHITIAFPFNSDITKEELENKILCALKNNNIKPFEVVGKSITLKWDSRVNKYYIFLGFEEGYDEILKLNNVMYKSVLEKELKFEFIPHITLGCISENEYENFKLELNDAFECVIDKIYVERIGENEESIIESVISFDN